jgi:pimeloyl-ACP methyl ester carboxylesterase
LPYFTTADSCKLFYTTYGFETSKPVVIFLNGTTQTTLYWGAHVPVLSKHFCLLFYDARAQGQSDLGMRPLTLQLHVSDLKELMGHLAINKAHLVGLSHGAQVAQAFWGDHPEMVGHIVLCSMGFKTNERARTVIKSWIEVLQLSGLEAMAWAALPIVFGNKFLKQNEKMLDKIVKAVVKRNRKKSLIAHLKAVLNYPPSDGIAYRHSPPMLVISGLEDPIINSADVHQLADFYKARLEELSSIGHSIPAETPHIFERLLIDFLVKSE